MAYNLMNQGRCGVLQEDCGTDGLGTCVGVALQADDAWFVAHIDCATIVRSGTDPAFGLVRDWTQGRMQQVAGDAPGNAQLYLVSNQGDFSARAIVAGIQAWAHETGTVKAYDGFIMHNGAIQSLGSGYQNNTDGSDTFSVPNLVAAPAEQVEAAAPTPE